MRLGLTIALLGVPSIWASQMQLQKPQQTKQYPVLTEKDFPPLKNDLILRTIRGEVVEHAPVWICRQAGRYLPEYRAVLNTSDFFTVCRTPELACEVTLQPIDRYGDLLSAAIIFSDILVVPQALGMDLQMIPGKGPTFTDPLLVPSDVSRLAEHVDVDKELGYVFEAITLTRHKLEGRVPLFGFAGGPWTIVAYMIEGGGSKLLSRAKTWLYQYPVESQSLLQRVTDVTVDYLIGQAKAGAQILQVFDSWAGELSPAEFRKFSLPYLTQIVTRVKNGAAALGINIPMSVFAKGGHYALEDLQAAGYDVIQIDWTVDPAEARLRTHGKVVLQGNADPAVLYAARDEIRAVVKRMVAGFGSRQMYIGNLGHGMHPDHDPEHLKWYIEAIREYSADETIKAQHEDSEAHSHAGATGVKRSNADSNSTQSKRARK